MPPITFRTRFAPSPTGLAHLGNARTALFSFLAARAQGGEMLLRLEDTDRSRNTDTAAAALERDLRWLGLDWREVAPQSSRSAAHEEKMAELAAKGLAYPCFCTPEELARERQQCAAAGKPPRYSGKCAKLPEKEAKARIAAGEKPAMRFRMPPEVVKVADAVRGELKFDGGDIGDFIIRRANGDFSFMFVNAIDDATDKVTCALRGEDHLPNTPRQLALLSALNLPPPQYGHLPLMTGADGKPLSKRTGAASLRDLREAGYLPQAVMNYLARVGHAYDGAEFMTAEEMINGFDLSRVSRSSARFDGAQLLNRQREALQRLDGDGRLRWMSGVLPGALSHDANNAQMGGCFDLPGMSRSSARFGGAQLLNRLREALLQLLGGNDRLRWMPWGLPHDVNNPEKVKDFDLPRMLRSSAHFDGAKFASAMIDNVALLDDVHEWARAWKDADPSDAARKVITEAGADSRAIAALVAIAANAKLSSADDWKSFCTLMELAGVSGKRLFAPLRAELTRKTSGPEMAAFFNLLKPEERERKINNTLPRFAAPAAKRN